MIFFDEIGNFILLIVRLLIVRSMIVRLKIFFFLMVDRSELLLNEEDKEEDDEELEDEEVIEIRNVEAIIYKLDDEVIKFFIMVEVKEEI